MNIVSWIIIFISVILFFSIISFIIYFSNNSLLFLSIIIEIIGIIIGVFIAEYVRRKYGCPYFLGMIRDNPELNNPSDTIKKDIQKEDNP